MDNMALGYALGQDSNGNSGNGNGMWGGDGSWIFAFLIIALIFGRNGLGGWGGNDGGGNGGSCCCNNGAVTRSDLCSEFAFNDLQRSVAGVNTGLCDGFYAMNTSILNGFHGVDNAVCNMGYQTQQGFAGVNSAICNLGYNQAQLANNTNVAMMQGFNGVTAGLNGISNQIASCCCDTQRQIERGFCDVNYNLATNTTAIVQNAHNDTDRVLARLDAMENSRKDETIAALREQLTQANFAASQASQNAFITANQEAQTAEIIRRCCPSPVPSYQVPAPYPYCGCGNNGNNCGCC